MFRYHSADKILRGIRNSLLALLCLALPANSFAQSYKPLSVFPVETVFEEHKTGAAGFDITVNFYRHGNDPAMPADFIKQEVDDATVAIFTFALENSLPVKECRGDVINDKLEVYQITVNTLNDESIIDGWQASNPHAEGIWGMYDPYFVKADTSVILLTDHSDQTTKLNRVLFAHELAHYWYHRLCWGSHWTGDFNGMSASEHFVQSFQVGYAKEVFSKN